jgi:hypothetical protein
MDDGKWERYGALGGVLFVILVIAAIIVTGGNAMASDSATKILKYYRDHQDGIKVGAFLSVLASLPIIWWAGSLWARLQRLGDRHQRLAVIAVLGLLIGGVGNLTQTAVNAGVALSLGSVSATTAKFFFVLSQAFGAGGLVGIAVLVFAVSAATFRLGVFPTWVGWLGVLDGLLFLVGSYSIATTGDAIGTFGFIAFILWAIWILVTSVLMYRAAYPIVVDEIVITETVADA